MSVRSGGLPDRSVRRIRQAVRDDLGVSLRAWALGRGFRPGTVYAAVRSWGWRLDQAPHGGLARQIVARLKADLPAATWRRLVRECQQAPKQAA